MTEVTRNIVIISERLFGLQYELWGFKFFSELDLIFQEKDRERLWAQETVSARTSVSKARKCKQAWEEGGRDTFYYLSITGVGLRENLQLQKL